MTWQANMKGRDMQSTVMQTTVMTLVRQRGCASKTFNSTACAVKIGSVGFAMAASPASAFVGGTDSSLQQQLRQNSQLTEIVVRRGAVRRTTVVGPRGGVASRTVVRRGAVVRPGVARAGVVRPGRWARPARYCRPAGGAVAAGAAIGFVAAATAAAWAGAPPAPGYRWYYTDPGRTQGFRDVCPH
jgi:hypothetical protein